MSSIYIVTQGAYSDYHIVAVYDNEADAQYHADVLMYSDDDYYKASVEEYVVNEPNAATTAIAARLRPYEVVMQRNGDVVSVSGCTLDDNELESDVLHGRQTEGYLAPVLWPPVGEFHVLARDEAHAVKIASERRTRWLVEDKWPEQFTEDFVWKHPDHVRKYEDVE